MPAGVLIPLVALLVMAATMLGELALSRRNERRLEARGAVDAPDPVYSSMRIMYPLVFILMGLEGMMRGAGIDIFLVDVRGPGWWTWVGLVVFAAGKIVKYWAIATLGERWTYRVLVLPGAPLVKTGPYAFMRHPNYVGVVGELIGMALLTSAWMSGVAGTVWFGECLRQRMQAENRALGYDQSA